MAYTIRQFVTSALEEIGLASFVFDVQPEKLATAAQRMNSMLAEWNAKGIRLGATLYSNPDDIDLDADSGVPDRANEAVITNLACRIAPGFGKAISGDTRLNAKRAYDAMALASNQPIEMQLGAIPAGAGNKPWRYGDPFLLPPIDALDTGSDGPLEFS